MKVKKTIQNRDVLTIYNECFPPKRHASEAADDKQLTVAGQAHDDVTDALALSRVKHDLTWVQQNVGQLIWTYSDDFLELRYLKDWPTQIFPTKKYNNVAFMQEVFYNCLTYQRQYEQKHNMLGVTPTQGDELGWHGHLITSLIPWACQKIEETGKPEIRKTLLKRLMEFLITLAKKDFIKSGDSDLVALIATVLSQLRERLREEDEYIKSNQLEIALSNINFENMAGTVSRLLLLTLLNESVEANFVSDINNPIRTLDGLRIVDMSYAEFKRNYKQLGPDSANMRLLFKSEAIFEFLKKHFLLVAQLPSELKEFHAEQTRTHRLTGKSVPTPLELEKLNRIQGLITAGGASQKQIEASASTKAVALPAVKMDFPTFPMMQAYGQSIDLDVMNLAESIMNVRNGLFVAHYYHDIARRANKQAGNLVKILAYEEFIKWYTIASQCVGYLRTRLSEFLKKLEHKYQNQKDKLHSGYSAWVDNYMSAYEVFDRLLEEIDDHQRNISKVLDAMSISNIKQNMAELDENMTILASGLNLFASPGHTNRFIESGGFGQIQAHLDSMGELRDAQELIVNQKSEIARLSDQVSSFTKEHGESALVKRNEILEARHRSLQTQLNQMLFLKEVTDILPEKLERKGFKEAEIESVVATYQRILKDFDDKRLALDFINDSFDYVVKGLRAVQRLGHYTNEYLAHNQQSSIFCRFGHFHGRDGRNRALHFTRQFFKAHGQKYLEDMIQSLHTKYQKSSTRTLVLGQAYSDFMKNFLKDFDRHYQGMSGGNYARHSWRTYLYAYRREIEHASENVDYDIGDDDYFKQDVETWVLPKIRYELTAYERGLKHRAGLLVVETSTHDDSDPTQVNSLVLP